jgi:hypothetical protein
MGMRTLALGASLVLICLLGVLTVTVAIRNGVDILVLVSLVILALIGFGVFGALTSRPPEE